MISLILQIRIYLRDSSNFVNMNVDDIMLWKCRKEKEKKAEAELKIFQENEGINEQSDANSSFELELLPKESRSKSNSERNLDSPAE